MGLRTWLLAPAAVLIGLLLAAPPTPARAGADPTPLLAYYYIWFNVSSWNRAKIDYPLLGRYSSDEPSIMRAHIRMAKRAGIDGFIVSWKHTPVLDRRLASLVHVAARQRFRLAIVYEGLDFERRPLPVRKVASDFDYFSRQYAASLVFHIFEKPVVIWSGSWEFSRGQVQRVTRPRRSRLLILGSEKNAADYEAKARSFDGDAYYWSSVNPDTYPNYPGKLIEMARAIHAAAGLWFAPAAPGYDARLVGGHTVVDRRNGETLRREMNAAMQSDPDAISLISWNEFSENSHVEPSRKYDSTALKVLADIEGTHFRYDGDFASDEPGSRGGSIQVIAVIAVVVGLAAVGLYALIRRASAR
jgi:Glycosyl hydrolase family 99